MRVQSVLSPHPVTGLTYIQGAGWDTAMQMALKPDQLATGGLRAHQNSAASSDWGFHALHHILDVLLLFYGHNNVTETFFCSPNEEINERLLQLCSCSFLLHWPLERLRKIIIAQTLRSCVTPLMEDMQNTISSHSYALNSRYLLQK